MFVLRLDRIDFEGNVREHASVDGDWTLCGAELTASNVRKPAGSLRCTRCARLKRALSSSLLDADRGERSEFAATIVRVRDALFSLGITLGERFVNEDELAMLARSIDDMNALRLIAMAIQVLIGNRRLDRLEALCTNLATNRRTSEMR
jgi:hypothetical protein